MSSARVALTLSGLLRNFPQKTEHKPLDSDLHLSNSSHQKQRDCFRGFRALRTDSRLNASSRRHKLADFFRLFRNQLSKLTQ